MLPRQDPYELLEEIHSKIIWLQVMFIASLLLFAIAIYIKRC